MNKLTKLFFGLAWIAPAIYLAAIWSKLPERVPMKYDVTGSPIRYGNKTGLLVIIVILVVVNIAVSLLLTNLHRIDPKKKYREENRPRMQRLALAINMFISSVTCYIVYISQSRSIDFNVRIIVIAAGILLAVVGNYMYNIKPNYFAGLRLPWTLEDEWNWKKTHLLAGKLWFAGGLLIALIAILLPNRAVLFCSFAIIIILTIVPAVYSYRLYKKSKHSR